MIDDPQPPIATLIAGPNGAGKSTMMSRMPFGDARLILADDISRRYQDDGWSQAAADIRAGRDVIAMVDLAIRDRASFVHETNLAGTFNLRTLQRARDAGFWTRVIFVGLLDADIALQRVAARVRLGGHPVEDGTVRRRWRSGLATFFEAHVETADDWTFYDNSSAWLKPVAFGGRGASVHVANADLWAAYMRLADGEPAA